MGEAVTNWTGSQEKAGRAQLILLSVPKQEKARRKRGGREEEGKPDEEKVPEWLVGK